MVGDRTYLRRTELLVKEQQVYTQAQTGQHDLHQFATTKDKPGMHLFSSLNNLPQHFHTRRPCKLNQLRH